MRLERPIAIAALAIAAYTGFISEDKTSCGNKVRFIDDEIAVCPTREGLEVILRSGELAKLTDICSPEEINKGKTEGYVNYYVINHYSVIFKVVNIKTGEVFERHYAVPVDMGEGNCSPNENTNPDSVVSIR